MSYIDTKSGNQETIELAVIQKILQDKSDEVFEMVESSMWESALRNLKTLTNELEATHTQIDNDNKLEKSKLLKKENEQ